MTGFMRQLEEAADRVTVALDALLPRSDGPEARVMEAMRYAALGPGKRIRPFLAIECGRLVNAEERSLLRCAAALECIHSYSLIHDDLPAMDDDDVRRGRATVHKQYDEATAILAGDALQALAFEILAHPDTHGSAARRCELITRLAAASGAKGMVGGQMIDMAEDKSGWDMSTITRMQRMKTGALISYATEIGPILADCDAGIRRSFEGFAHDLGLAFQITDDLLDAEASSEEAGKRTGKDDSQGKATFVGILGVDGAREQAQRLVAQAKDHLDPFGERAKILRDAADYVLTRRA